MSKIQGHLELSPSLMMREETYTFDYETPAKIALEVAKNASPDSTGNEILAQLREAVSKSVANRFNGTVSSSTTADAKSLVIFHDVSSNSPTQNSGKVTNPHDIIDFKENKHAIQKGMSVKERMKQSIAQRRTALKEKNVNIQGNNHSFDMKQVVLDKRLAQESHKGQNGIQKVPHEVESPSLYDEASMGSFSLDLNTIESDSVKSDNAEEKAKSICVLEPVKEETFDDTQLASKTNEGYFQHVSNYSIAFPDDKSCASAAEKSTASKNPHGISVDRNELLSTSLHSSSDTSDCSSPAFRPDGNVNYQRMSPVENINSYENQTCSKQQSDVDQNSCISSPFSIGGTAIPDLFVDGSAFDLGSPFVSSDSMRINDINSNNRLYKAFEKPASLNVVGSLSVESTDETETSVGGGQIYLEDVVSPISKLLVAGLPPSNCDDSYVVSRSTASSLIERNKTLMKEVRFADQTCVELSERNASMRRDMERVKLDLKASTATNEDLHQSLVRSSIMCAKLEEERDFIQIRKEEEKIRYETQIENLKQSLEEERKRNLLLNEKFDLKSKELVLVEKKLVSVSSAYKVLHEERNDAKKKIHELTDRLFHLQSKEDDDETSRNFFDSLQTTVHQLEKTAQDRLLSLEKEREINIKLGEEMESMKSKCATFENYFRDGFNQSFTFSGTPSSSFDSTSESALCHKLSSTKLECEEYKRVLDDIITQIRNMQKCYGISQSDMVWSGTTSESVKLLSIARDLANSCVIVNKASADRINLLEERNMFLTKSISRLQDMCSEDSFRITGGSNAMDIVGDESNGMLSSSPIPKESLSCYHFMNENNESVISSMKNQVNHLQRQYEESLDELKELREVVEHSEDCLSKEQLKCRQLEENIREYKIEIEESSNQLMQSLSIQKSKENQIELLQCQVSALNDQIDFIRNEFQGQLDGYLFQLEIKNEEVLLKSKELENVRCLYEEINSKLEKLESELNNEKELRRIAQEAHQQLDLDVKTKSDQFQKTFSELKVAENTVVSLTSKLNNAYDDIRSMEKKQKDADAKLACELEENRKALEFLKVALGERDDQLAKALSDVDVLKQEKMEMSNNSTKQLEEKQGVIFSITSRLNEYEKKYQDLVGEMLDAKSIDESLVSEKDALIFKLQRRNESLDRKRSRLREYVKRLNSRCSVWEESFNEHNSETKNIREKYDQAMAQIQELMKQIDNQKNIDVMIKCEDCKYLRRALVMESIAASKRHHGK